MNRQFLVLCFVSAVLTTSCEVPLTQDGGVDVSAVADVQYGADAVSEASQSGEIAEYQKPERDCRKSCHYKEEQIRGIVDKLVADRKAINAIKVTNELNKRGREYSLKWRWTIYCYSYLESSELKDYVRKAWKNGLKRNDVSLRFQLRSADFDCGREVIDEEYWKLLETSKAKYIVANIAKAISLTGGPEELSRLDERLKYIARVESNRDLLRYIDGVFFRHKYMKTRKPGDFMLPTVPPPLPDHFPVEKIVLLKEPYVDVVTTTSDTKWISEQLRMTSELLGFQKTGDRLWETECRPRTDGGQ